MPDPDALDPDARDPGARDPDTHDLDAPDHAARDHGAHDHYAPDHGAPDHGAPDHGAPEHGARDPGWLVWGREIQALAQTGLEFSRDPYDLQRYATLRRLSARIMAAHTTTDARRIERLFEAETGYATPKVGVRGAVFDPAGRILMVREVVDQNRWTLPGGWADVNQTPAQSVVREVFEESGYQVRAVKLAAVWDRARQEQPAIAFSVVRMFFVCALQGGTPATSLETSEIGWFAQSDVPADLSLRRTLPRHINRMFAHWRDPALATEFD